MAPILPSVQVFPGNALGGMRRAHEHRATQIPSIVFRPSAQRANRSKHPRQAMFQTGVFGRVSLDCATPNDGNRGGFGPTIASNQVAALRLDWNSANASSSAANHSLNPQEAAMSPHVPSTSHATSTIDFLQRNGRVLMRNLERLLQREQTIDSRLDELHLVESMLESLPLASDQFEVYRNRVRNARRYVLAREPGAARFELQLLAGSLRGWLASQSTVEPRRRLGRSKTVE
jgi:hypothetical protein